MILFMWRIIQRLVKRVVYAYLSLVFVVNVAIAGEASPLIRALYHKNIRGITHALKILKEDANQHHEGVSALMFAVLYFPKAVTPLLKAGADPNQRDTNGLSPLMGASLYNPSAIASLVQGGARLYDETALGETALTFAISCNKKSLPFLLAEGADVNRVGGGWPPLMVAAQGNPQVIADLVAVGADLEYEQEGEMGLTPLLVAACLNPESVHELLKAGADPQAVNRLGCSPLETARLHGNVEGVRWILEYLRKIPGLDVGECKAEALRGKVKLEVKGARPWFDPDEALATELLWEGEVCYSTPRT